MARFRLRQRVRRVGTQEFRSIEEIRENPAAETMYSIQLGRDFATRQWANESELEDEACAGCSHQESEHVDGGCNHRDLRPPQPHGNPEYQMCSCRGFRSTAAL